jgi:hypothetical protein
MKTYVISKYQTSAPYITKVIEINALNESEAKRKFKAIFRSGKKPSFNQNKQEGYTLKEITNE